VSDACSPRLWTGRAGVVQAVPSPRRWRSWPRLRRRYAQVVTGAPRASLHIRRWTEFDVVERAPGNVTTDVGAPAVIATAEREPLEDAEAARTASLVVGCWAVFERVARHAPQSSGGVLEAAGATATGSWITSLRRNSPTPQARHQPRLRLGREPVRHRHRFSPQRPTKLHRWPMAGRRAMRPAESPGIPRSRLENRRQELRYSVQDRRAVTQDSSRLRRRLLTDRWQSC